MAFRSGAGEAYLAEVDRHLLAFLRQQREAMGSFAPESVLLVDEVVRLTATGGKRLRPLFCYWGYMAGGGLDGAPIARAGAAVEMLHTSALIHDDVVDRAHLRRGEAASFRRLALVPEVDCGADRFGASAAILAGDLAHVFADQLLSESGFRPDRIQAARWHFNRMRTEAVSGQFMDLLEAHSGLPASSDDRPGGETDAEQRSLRVAALKSGSYTVVGPLQMGAALAGAGWPLHRALERYGRPLGEAFQLRDDVLGTFGDPVFTGKDRDGDIREGKRTTLVAKAWRLSTRKGRRLLADGLGRDDLTGEEVEAIRGVIRGSGALAETIELIEGLAARARRALRAGPFPEDAARALSGLAGLVALRDA